MAAGPLNLHIKSFVLHLRTEKKSDRTVTMYRESVAWFAAEHLLAGGQPTDIDHRYETSADTCADMVTFEPVRDWELVNRVHIRSWLARLHRREYSSSYVNNQYRCLQQFFKWLADEEEIGDPMRKVKAPKVVAKPVPVFEDGEIDRILKMPRSRNDRGAAKRGDACRLRDAAIIQFLRDTGVRLAELAGLKLTDVSLDKRRAFVTGKGDKSRYVKFTHATAKALDRYLRQRAQHPDAHLPFLWLSQKGKALTPSGIYQMLYRRARRSGVGQGNTHRYRHDFSHRYLAGGGQPGDLMELNGWESEQMTRHYGRSAAAERAQRHYDPGDVRKQLNPPRGRSQERPQENR
ncbi:tyrosine-type recombinase/integrase [Nocardiopsis valliformis]|uniref:tyrosine-type recombinase/integrase n=1 Tax=Nocardiopsis valliformis TaxID=239974 RepID=UPI000344C408|nr:tyrosine-type recombinase/integrase [Nocardiopsis valliformis]